MRLVIQHSTTRQPRATCHINFPADRRRQEFRIHPDRPSSRDLTMFASASCPSRRRHWTSTLSCGIQTPSNFASIARCVRRQYDPQHEAGMWQSRVLAQLAVLDATNSQSCISYEDNVSLLSSVLVSTRKAAHAQSSPAVPCRVSNPGSLRRDTGVYPYCRV